MIQVYRINKNGDYLEPVVTEKDYIPADCVIKRPPDGLYKPSFVSGVWIERATPEEIAALNKPSAPSELDVLEHENEQLKKRVTEMENAILALMDMNL